MRIRKILFICLLIVLCSMSFVSCTAAGAGTASTVDEEEQKWDESGLDAPFPTMIDVNGFHYFELDLETIQNLNLAVESCDGLREIGKVDTARVRCESKEDGSLVLNIRRTTLKNKKDYDARGVAATIDETVYAYPDPQYPNLLVAVIDGEPVVFGWGGSDNKEYLKIEVVLKEIFGLDTAGKIQAIRVRNIQGVETGIIETMVTDQAELETFYNAIYELPGKGKESSPYDAEKAFACYECIAELKNGFSFSLTYYPHDNSVGFCGALFEVGSALAEWITAHGEP